MAGGRCKSLLHWLVCGPPVTRACRFMSSMADWLQASRVQPMACLNSLPPSSSSSPPPFLFVVFDCFFFFCQCLFCSECVCVCFSLCLFSNWPAKWLEVYIRSGTDQLRSVPNRPTRLRGRKTTILIQLGSRSLSGKIMIDFRTAWVSQETIGFVCLFCFVCLLFVCLFVFTNVSDVRCTWSDLSCFCWVCPRLQRLLWFGWVIVSFCIYFVPIFCYNDS